MGDAMAGSIREMLEQQEERTLHPRAGRSAASRGLAPKGDHYRNRLTHTLEVAQVAGSIARALRLNEMLVEAVVMGHDLGHTPFGHAGERLLNEVVPNGFHHVTQEVRDGILRHSKGRGNVLMKGSGAKALTLEAEVVRLADIIAYVNHDLDDALRAGLLVDADLPSE